MNFSSAPVKDIIALALFLFCWLGYGQAAKYLLRSRPSLISTINIFRERWMRNVCKACSARPIRNWFCRTARSSSRGNWSRKSGAMKFPFWSRAAGCG